MEQLGGAASVIMCRFDQHNCTAHRCRHSKQFCNHLTPAARTVNSWVHPELVSRSTREWSLLPGCSENGVNGTSAAFSSSAARHWVRRGG